MDRAPSDLELFRPLEPSQLLRLDNGLTVCVAENHRAPVVATAIVYNAGTKHEQPAYGGAAHFLEHMMFKGSERFGPGEIDLLTRALGGSNNAFTSHDSTLYYFTFAADRWQKALAVEADRLAGLRLEAHEVDAERQVILEEISMYEGEPWDALDLAVSRELHGDHPYGRPVLGGREDLARIDGAILRDFHARFYRPGNATVVITGDVDGQAAVDAVAEHFGAIADRPSATPPVFSSRQVRGPRRVERRHGEVARLMISLPGPAASSSDHAQLRLLLAILGTGRSSRLHRALVDQGQVCGFATADLHENVEPGSAVCAAEVIPGASPAQVEALMRSELEKLTREPPTLEEMQRARQMLLADWLFGHEKVDQQAFLLGISLTLFDLEHPRRYFSRLFDTDRDQLLEIGQKYLRLDHDSVVGWSLPS